MASAAPDLACWIDAALGDGAWTAVLDMCAELLGAPQVALGLAAKPGVPGEVVCSSGASPGFRATCLDLLDAYGAEAIQSRPTPDGRLVWVHAASSARRQVQDVAVFALWPAAGDPVLLQRIATMAARAVSARRRISEMRAALALRSAAFDRLPFGVSVIDDALYVHEPNAACRDIFQRADGLSLHQDRLVCRVEGDNHAVAEAVRRTLEGTDEDVAVRVGRARGAEPYVVKPVAAPAAAIHHCLLLIIDPEKSALFARETWRALDALNACELIGGGAREAERARSRPAGSSSRRARPN